MNAHCFQVLQQSLIIALLFKCFHKTVALVKKKKDDLLSLAESHLRAQTF